MSNEIVQHHDWLPTFLAAAGEPDIVEKLKKGHTSGDKTFKVHIDGFNLLPYLTGEVDKSPRRGFIYFSDDCDVLGIRFENWKVVFMEQRCPGTLRCGPSRSRRCGYRSCSTCAPIRSSAPTSRRTPTGTGSSSTTTSSSTRTTIVTQFLETFKEFPPRHPPATFTIDQALEKLHEFLAED